MTKYAKKIEEIVATIMDHPTAEEIFHELQKTYPEVVLATVYNNLNSLTQKKRIRRINIEGEPDRYDCNTVRHDHLRCVLCGKLTDIVLPDLTEMIDTESGEVIEGYDLMIHYICPDCRRKMGQEDMAKEPPRDF